MRGLAYALFKGPDNDPQWFEGFDHNQRPRFADEGDITPRPQLYTFKRGARGAYEAWRELEKLGIKVELMELKTGYCEFQLPDEEVN